MVLEGVTKTFYKMSLVHTQFLMKSKARRIYEEEKVFGIKPYSTSKKKNASKNKLVISFLPFIVLLPRSELVVKL